MTAFDEFPKYSKNLGTSQENMTLVLTPLFLLWSIHLGKFLTLSETHLGFCCGLPQFLLSWRQARTQVANKNISNLIIILLDRIDIWCTFWTLCCVMIRELGPHVYVSVKPGYHKKTWIWAFLAKHLGKIFHLTFWSMCVTLWDLRLPELNASWLKDLF